MTACIQLRFRFPRLRPIKKKPFLKKPLITGNIRQNTGYGPPSGRVRICALALSAGVFSRPHPQQLHGPASG